MESSTSQKPQKLSITAIAAINNNNVLADDGTIPWNCPEDKEHYKQTVSDSPVLIGRKTYQDAPPLPGPNIVLTRTGIKTDRENVYQATSVEEAFELLDELNITDVYNVGGEQIYRLFLEYTDKLVISHIDNDEKGDTEFPEIDSEDWVVTETDNRDSFVIKYYSRR